MDYSIIDNSPIVNYLFFPREHFSTPPEGAFDMMVPVEEGVHIHCRFYQGERKEDPWLLYFHGNGEVVSDYDEIAMIYLREGINIVVADYRGYGSSTGAPDFTKIVKDASKILGSVKNKLEETAPGFSGLWAMGRSLGSMPALAIAEECEDDLEGLIIESGFVSIVDLIKHFRLPEPGDLDHLKEKAREKVKRITLPALVIHGERDHIVPLSQGEELYELLGSKDKRIFTVPRAGHNDIFFIETEKYMREIKKFIAKINN